MATIKVTDNNFETEVIKAEKPVIVDFWASGVLIGPLTICQRAYLHCKAIEKILLEISNEMSEVKIANYNIDK